MSEENKRFMEEYRLMNNMVDGLSLGDVSANSERYLAVKIGLARMSSNYMRSPQCFVIGALRERVRRLEDDNLMGRRAA